MTRQPLSTAIAASVTYPTIWGAQFLAVLTRLAYALSCHLGRLVGWVAVRIVTRER